MQLVTMQLGFSAPLAACRSSAPHTAAARASSGVGASISGGMGLACAHIRPLAGQRQRQQTRRMRCTASKDASALASADESVGEVSGLNTTYCDDFQCTSSPAVEQTIRSVARDLQRITWSPSLFARDVEYKDPLLSLKGRESYARNRFVRECVQDAQVKVLSMCMVDGGTDTAEVCWRLTGSVRGMPIDVRGTETLTLNQVTGLVMRHVSGWDTSACNPLGGAAYTVERTLWSAKQAATSVKEGTNRALDSLTSMNEEDDRDVIVRNPDDPTKFFQQQDNTFNDAVALALLLAVLWAVVQGWSAVFSL